MLETARLLIRPFELGDLQAAFRLFDLELSPDPPAGDGVEALGRRTEWLKWAALNHRQLALLEQPPYGDRAVILKESGALIGSVGFAPCLAPFEQMPNFDYHDPSGSAGRSTAEVGLFYAVSPLYQRQGYATEAVKGMIDYAFQNLLVKQIIATTEYDNLASQAVMRKLGMTIARNPLPEPDWLQVVGLLKNDLD